MTINRTLAFSLSLSFLGLNLASLPQATATDPAVVQDPAVIRYYPFEEGYGDWAAQLAGDGKGRLMLVGNSPYGVPDEHGTDKWKGPVVGTEWRKGRFPGTFSIRPGLSARSATNSLFYGTDTGSFSLETWVRPEAGSNGPFLWSADAYHSGFHLAQQGNSMVWRIATTEEPVQVSAPFTPNLWHHVVATWDAESQQLALYVNGQPGGSVQAGADYVAPKPDKSALEAPEKDYGGLNVGGTQSSQVGAARFDMDELVIYSRALKGDEIAQRHAKGSMQTSPEEQLEAFSHEQEELKVLESVRMEIPHDTFGYFPREKEIPLTFSVPANTIWNGTLTATWKMENLAGEMVSEGSRELKVTDASGDSATIPLSMKTCGLYFLQVELRDAGGNRIQWKEYPVGIIVPLPPVEAQPETSPLASHATVWREPEGAVLGFGAVNRETVYGKTVSPGVYAFPVEDDFLKVAQSRGMESMFCVNLVPKAMDEDPDSEVFNLARYKKRLAAMVRHFKGKVKYWEILNEPNSGHHSMNLGNTNTERAKKYVGILKAAHEVIRREDPEAIIVGISGCPGFIAWLEAVMAAGGGPYFDVVTIHNYRPAPIQKSIRDPQIQPVREILDRYDKDVPIWNGEFGIKQAGPVNGRPMAAEAFYEQYKERLNYTHGMPYLLMDMHVVPAKVAAAWTMQSVLLDLADGCERVFQLAGASNAYPGPADSGLPSEKGVAMAALAEVLLPSKTVERLPMASISDAGVLVKTTDGRRIAAVFSDDDPELLFLAEGFSEIHGMDMLGNPQTWPVDKNGVLRVRASMSPVYLYDVPEGFAQIAIAKAEGEGVLVNDESTGTLVLQNPSTADRKYQLAMDVPKGLRVESPDEVTVPARGSLNVPFKLVAKDLKRGIHELAFRVADENGQLLAKTQTMLSATDTTIMIPQLREAIPLRANPADWEGIPATKIDSEDYILSGRPVPAVPWAPQWRGPWDLSFTYRLAWHPEDGLCLLLEVRDDQINVAPEEKFDSAFQYDCLELFLDIRPPSMRRAGFSQGVEQVLVIPATSDTATRAEAFSMSRDTSQLKIRFVGRRTDDGYILEGRIGTLESSPWHFEKGISFAMDLMLDDADEALRKTIMGIGFGGLDNSRNTSKWGWFQLGPPIPEK